jgi:hypothetical protein
VYISVLQRKVASNAGILLCSGFRTIFKGMVMAVFKGVFHHFPGCTEEISGN